MTRRSRFCLWTILLGASLFAGAARADIAAPKPHHTCHARDVAEPGERCVDCFSTYEEQERCVLEQVPLGRERRCIYRGTTAIDEVWCDVPPNAPSAAPAPSSPAPAPQDNPSPSGGCQIGSDGRAPSGLWITLLALAITARRLSRPRRRWWSRERMSLFAGLLLSAGWITGCGRSQNNAPPAPSASAEALEKEQKELDRKRAELQKKIRQLEEGPILELPEWSPRKAAALGAFFVDLPEGWGEDSPPSRFFSWSSPKAGRRLGIELRLSRAMPRSEHETRLYRSITAEERALPEADVARLGELLLFPPSPAFTVRSARVRSFGGARALVIEGDYPLAKVSRTSVFADAESDEARPASLDHLQILLPKAEQETYSKDITHILDKLTITRRPRSRECGNMRPGEGEICEVCAFPPPKAEPRGFREDPPCVQEWMSRGYDARGFEQECALFCLPKDPAKVRANIAEYKATANGKCKCAPGDPLCSCL